MYIEKYIDNTYAMELNEQEFAVLKKLYGKLLFNPECVSNQFKLPTEDIEIIKHMNRYLHGVR